MSGEVDHHWKQHDGGFIFRRFFPVAGALTIRIAVPSDAQPPAELSGILGYSVAADAVSQRLGRLLGQTAEAILVAECPWA